TDSGVQNIYDSTTAKQAAPKPKQKPAPERANARLLANPSATLQATAQHAPAMPSQEVVDERKTVPKKQKSPSVIHREVPGSSFYLPGPPFFSSRNQPISSSGISH